MATASFEAFAFWIAVAPNDAASILDQSQCADPPHPDPCPSGVRTVVVRTDSVVRE
jgi:hypothetical protein